MSKDQKIECNVDSCMHNDLSQCKCKLEKIQVCPCNDKGSKTPEAQTACSMYHYYGDLNRASLKNERQSEET